MVAGNHDWAVAGLTEYKDTNSVRAVAGIEYTKKVITNENLRWLRSLPLRYREDGIEFVHASPVSPENWRYLTLGTWGEDSIRKEVNEALAGMNGQICFVGHSYIPAIFLEESPKNVKKIDPGKSARELKDCRAIVDVGSIGCPRILSKRASLVIFARDTKTVHFRTFPI